MKKYKVMREMPCLRVGDIVEIDRIDIIEGNILRGINTTVLVSEGWLAEVPEEKELWEKIYNYFLPCTTTECTAREVAKIARQHFAEVARKAAKEWNKYVIDSHSAPLGKFDYIIQAIEKDGEK